MDCVATGLKQAPQLGLELIATDFQTTLGSASAIFASGVAKLGHQVTFISKVGDDDFGEFCLAALRRAGVSTDYVQRDRSTKTGVTLSLSTRQDRALVTYLGAISSLNYKDVEMSVVRGASHLHLTSYFLQNALRPAFPRIFKEARAAGLTTSFDPNSDPSQTWGDRIWQVLAQTDILFLNRAEAIHLSRARGARRALKVLGSRAPCVVIKLGPKGAIGIKGDEMASSPGFSVNTLDTTGAGDSFAAGFVSAYLQNHALEQCLRIGNACGAISTLKAGGTTSQPDSGTLKRFLKKHSR